MKQCKNCGITIDDGVNFCPNCGSAEFVVGQAQAFTNAPTGCGVPNSYGQAGQFAQPGGGFAQPIPQKKSLSWWKVLLIIFGVTFVAIFVVMLAEGDFKEYDIGSFSGNTYTNEWADIEVDIPSDWVVEDKLLTDDDCDCAFITANESKNEVVSIIYADNDYYTTHKKLVKSLSEDLGIDLEKTSIEKLAGSNYNIYTGHTINIKGSFLYYKIYIKEKGDRFISAIFIADDESKLSSMTSMIKKVK